VCLKTTTVQFDVQTCQADFVMADGHKWMLGPEGLSVFYTSPTAREQLKLTQFGWHMMDNTHNYENKPCPTSIYGHQP
jgi:selenocysteine lyase/cysteine desulfurase